jgi:hypothetical protein
LQTHAPHVHVSLLAPGWVKTKISGVSVDTETLIHQNFPDATIEWLLKFAKSVRKGIPPEQVAEQVFLAIEKNQFYIFTDEVMKQKVISERTEAILNDGKPVSFL